MKLVEVFSTPKKILYSSDKTIGFNAVFYKPKGRTNDRIRFEYNGKFKKSIVNPDEAKSIHQKIALEYFPFSTPRVFRLDLFRDYKVKEKYWYLGIDEIFPCFYKNKSKYPDLPYNSPVRYVNDSMNNDRDPQKGYNDQATEGREFAMTHFTGGVYRRSVDKKYDKSASQKRLYLKGKLTASDYQDFIKEVGLTSFNEPNRIIRSELMLTGDSAHFASCKLIEARARCANQKEFNQIKKEIRSQYAKNHRLVDTSTIPPNGDIYKAKTNKIFEYDTELKPDQETKKLLLQKLATTNQLDPNSLKKIAPLPEPKRTIESITKSLAKEIVRQKDGSNLKIIIQEYIPSLLKELIIEIKQDEYKSYYHFYSQKALVSSSKEEKEYYINQANKAKEEGFIYKNNKNLYYKGDEGTPVKSTTTEMEESLLNTKLDE